MKSLKKTLVLLVVFSMILSAVMPAFAATDIYGLDCEEEVARLEALKVVTGYEDGSYGPEKTITRAEMAVILCKMVGIDTVTVEENKNVPSKFSDVAAGEWYTGYINVAAGKGLLSGFPDGTFRPSEQLTMNQVLTLCVNALGRGEYVAEMGTWPANYIAEATKLGLLDGVKTSDANRGNVAIIVWNTLEAPYVWDVTNTEYEGTINLGNSTRSLLSIYFRDFVAELENRDGEVVGKYLKEAEYVEVTAVPSTNSELGEKQFVVEATSDTDTKAYDALLADIRENKKPRGTDAEEWTTADANDAILAYAPAFEDLDSYYGKIVTVIFGKDNEVVSIRIVDDTLDNEYLTAFEKDKLTIGANSYKFDDDARVYVNTVEITNDNRDAKAAMEEIESILHIDFDKDFNKVIKSNIILSSKGKITRLDLFVSGNYDEFKTKEAVVSKVRNEVITLTNKEEIDYGEDGEYEDEDDQPRILKNSKVIAIEDIEVGDVLTYYYNDNDVIKTIYVASEKVDGELTRVSKTDLRMTVDGEKYYSSMGDITGKFLFTDDKISDAENTNNADDQIGENVTLYLNIYGEYVLMASEKASENWVFGIVTKVNDEEDDEEDEHVFYKSIRVLLADGTTSRNYKFVYDDEETYTNDWDDIDDLKNTFIVFAPDANGEIELDDYEEIDIDTVSTTEASIADDDYEIIKVVESTEVDDDRQRIEGKVFGDKSVIFTLGYENGKYDPDVSKDWEILIKNDSGKKLQQGTVLVYEADSKTLTCVLIKESNYATSDSEYAIVVTDDYKEKKGSTTKKYVDLLLADASEAETFEAKELNDEYVLDMEKMFVEYQLSGSKLSEAALLIDLPAFKKLKATDTVTGEIEADGIDTNLATTIHPATSVTAANAVHGTLACTGVATATTCTCTGFTAYQAAVNAVHGTITCGKTNVDGNHITGCSETSTGLTSTPCTGTVACTGADTDTTCACTGFTAYQAAVNAVHGTIACTGPATATTCTCTGFTAYHGASESKGTTKANFRVIDTQKLLLEYEDDEDTEIEENTKIGDIILDEDVVVYDARGGKLVETTFSALRDEVEADGYVYVIPFANSDLESGSDANILVIVD